MGFISLNLRKCLPSVEHIICTNVEYTASMCSGVSAISFINYFKACNDLWACLWDFLQGSYLLFSSHYTELGCSSLKSTAIGRCLIWDPSPFPLSLPALKVGAGRFFLWPEDFCQKNVLVPKNRAGPGPKKKARRPAKSNRTIGGIGDMIVFSDSDIYCQTNKCK